MISTRPHRREARHLGADRVGRHRTNGMEGQLSAHAKATADMQQHIADIKHAQKGMESEVTGVKRELAVVDAQAPMPPQPQVGWDRAPDRTKVRITSKAEGGGRDGADQEGDTPLDGGRRCWAD